MKGFKGKAIYNPSGKAGEYAEWACNFYVGCSNGCTYCYCKKGVLASTMGGDKPTLKKFFKSEERALDIFRKELLQNMDEVKEYGVFFSFTTDPMLPETIRLTFNAINSLVVNNVPVKVLTKRADWVDEFLGSNGPIVCDGKAIKIHKIAFGFTLTGHDELEPNASTNAERIDAMNKLHDAGFKTFASIEPIIDLNSSLEMIKQTVGFCNLYKIGLESGKKYNRQELCDFVEMVNVLSLSFGFKVYWKDSLLKQAGIDRSWLLKNCVGREYNMFNQE
jgi:DNA repair photolyase